MPRRLHSYRAVKVRPRAVRPWRGALLAVVAAWNRYQVARIVGAVATAWVIGATALYFAERRVNSDFATWDESLWSVWVLLFSGLHEPPKTTPGRLVTMAMLVLGVGIATIASRAC